MFERIGKSWFRRMRHPSDEELIRFIDGEADAKAADRTETHLGVCWECRARRQRMDRTIEEFVSLRPGKIAEEIWPPPRDWRGFEYRLAQLAAEEDEAMREKPPPARLPWFWNPANVLKAAAAALFLAAILWLPGRFFTVSAKELLLSALQTEQASLENVTEPVLHERVRIQCSWPDGKSLGPSVLELWTGAGGDPRERRGDSAVWEELDSILRANGISAPSLISVASYEEWRKAAGAVEEKVSRRQLDDGRKAWVLTARRSPPYPPGRIFESSTLYSSASWMPLRQTWKIHTEDGVGECELSRLLYEVFARRALGDSLFAAADVSTDTVTVPVAEPASVPEITSVPNALRTEIEVIYALHRIGACRRGNLEAHRLSDGFVSVRGVVPDESEKQRLIAAVSEIDSVRIEVELAGLVQATQEPAERNTGETIAEDLPVELAVQQIPAEKQLLRHLGSSTEMSGVSVAKFSNEIVTLSQNCWNEAWALRRLDQEFSESEVKNLDNTSRWLLEVMVCEHADTLENHLALLQSKIMPVFRPDRRDGELPFHVGSEPDSAALLEVVASADALIHHLFTVPSQSAKRLDADEIPAGNAAKKLLSKLPEARAKAFALRQQVDRAFSRQ